MIYIPDYGDKYYYLTHDGTVCWSIFSESTYDIEMLGDSNVFETHQEASEYRDVHLRVIYEWTDGDLKESHEWW